MKTLLNSLLLVSILLTYGCIFFDKDEPKPADVLPPYTQQGANTIGCLVDGRVFVPQKNDLDGYTFEYYRNELTFYIHKDNERVYIGIWDGTVNDTGVYDLKFIRGKREVYYINTQIGGGDAINGQLHIKYWNKQKHIMAGTFYFDALKGDSSIIKITEGRFDMIYN